MKFHVHKAIQPHETLFVVDAMTGQDAVYSKSFNDILNFDVILTKLDGDTWWSCYLIKTVVNKPTVCRWEKMEALDVFYPIRMAERILEWEMLCL
jgi:signal recognition particle subunit SRP54